VGRSAPIAILVAACLVFAGCSTPPDDTNRTDGTDGVDANDSPDTDDNETSKPQPDPSTSRWPSPDEIPEPDPATLGDLVDRQLYHDNGTPRYRTPGTDGHNATIPDLVAMLEERGANVSKQTFQTELPRMGEVNLTNVYGERAGNDTNEIWLGAHWDSRAWADAYREPCTGPPVLGANDGAAGVAVVLHVLEILPPTDATVRVALFDGEDQGCAPSDVSTGFGSSSWAVGSTHAAETLSDEELGEIQGLVLVDMPGDKELEIRREGYSEDQAPRLTNTVFGMAHRLDAPAFINESAGGILDDHVPFLDQGVPAVDLIHLDEDGERGVFSWTHHTENDTREHVSSASMAQVARVTAGTVMAMDS
jgi:hypothetical protein